MIEKRDHPVEFERWVREDADCPDAGVLAPDFRHDIIDRLYLMIHQGTWWCDKFGCWSRLVDMEPSHRRRLLDQLRKRAELWRSQWSDQMDHGDPTEEALFWASLGDDGEAWLERLPLVRALAAFDDRVNAPVVS